ncbi:DUF4062 domain-containing protein [Variovorax sp. EL159]|uniref:DUF4062 domain-containing protein n=1 Tax=unclassified Variovorax TaxID=663243 RepID=UPI00088BE17A|nr:DUF4062 domain-containing protein [Variovorax sp. EL159]SCX74557.1 protein of unknown function [Variovorax sp. EL159]
MPRQTTAIQIFVASPGDVANERDILESVITQLNLIWSQSLGITFELVKWETNVHPSFSSDPQAAINEQIGAYDVFIGIFWGRLGTPTPRADSGTIEEFDQAYARWKQTKSPEIMLYFKDAPIAPSKIDTQQLLRVQQFKKSLSDKGGLYFEFEDEAGFESSLRGHLSAIAQKFSTQTQLSNSLSIDSSLPISSLLPEDDFGYIDYLEIYDSKLSEMTQALDTINEATERVGEQLSQRTDELKTQIVNAGSARRFIKRSADDMSSYADTLNSRISVISASRKIAFDALTNALALRADFEKSESDVNDLSALRQTLQSLVETSNFAKSGMRGMRESADALPRISKDINLAKRSMVSKLDLFMLEIESIQSTVINIVDAIDRILGTGAKE